MTFRKKIGRLICRIKGKHALAETEVIADCLIQLTCPRCGAFALLTQTDLENSIIEALTKEGKYTNIERIA